MTCGDDGEPEPIQKLQDLVNKYNIASISNCCDLIRDFSQDYVEKVLLLWRR